MQVPLQPQQPVVPSSGGPGAAVAISANFAGLLGGYAPDDILCVSNDEVEDEQFLWGRCTALGASMALVEIEETHPYPQPARLDLVFGTGSEVTHDSIDGVVFYDGPGYVWRASGTAPVVTTTNKFLALPSGAREFHDPCANPPTTVRQPFRLDPDGCVRARVPGTKACEGDKLSATLYIEVSIAGVPRTSLIMVPATTPLPSTKTAWGVATSYVTVPLGTDLDPLECDIGFVGGHIEICPRAGTTITKVGDFSAFVIELDPTQHTQFSGRQGDIDDFVFESGTFITDDLPDPLADGGAFFGWLYNLYGTSVDDHPLLNYDEQDCDRWLYDILPNDNTVGNLGTLLANGAIRSAVLEVHFTAHACQTETDSIIFGWDGDLDATNWLWGIGMTQLDELFFEWNPGDEATMCFDLCQLPNFAGNLTSILHEVSLRDTLNLMISDDTAVDYVELKVLRCNP